MIDNITYPFPWRDIFHYIFIIYIGKPDLKMLQIRGCSQRGLLRLSIKSWLLNYTPEVHVWPETAHFQDWLERYRGQISTAPHGLWKLDWNWGHTPPKAGQSLRLNLTRPFPARTSKQQFYHKNKQGREEGKNGEKEGRREGVLWTMVRGLSTVAAGVSAERKQRKETEGTMAKHFTNLTKVKKTKISS